MEMPYIEWIYGFLAWVLFHELYFAFWKYYCCFMWEEKTNDEERNAYAIAIYAIKATLTFSVWIACAFVYIFVSPFKTYYPVFTAAQGLSFYTGMYFGKKEQFIYYEETMKKYKNKGKRKKPFAGGWAWNNVLIILTTILTGLVAVGGFAWRVFIDI